MIPSRASTEGAVRSLRHALTAPRSVRAPSRADTLIALGTLTIVGVAAYGWYVLHGGLYIDDWANAASYRFAAAPRYWSAVHAAEAGLGGRPVLALLLPLPTAAFGTDPKLQLLLALGLGILTSLCFYLLLRALGMKALDSTVIAALALLFPWSDSIRLWATGSLNSLAVCSFLLAVVVALRGLERSGARAVLTHGLAVFLYVLSVLTYEVAAGAALLAGLLYFGRGTARAAARCWLVDCVAVGAVLTYSLLATVSTRHVGGLSERLHDAPETIRQSVYLFVWTLVPTHGSNKVVQALVLLGVAVAVIAGLVGARGAGAQELRLWLVVAAASVIVIGAAYFIFLGSYLHPQDPGIGTRTNVFAGLAYAALVYALIAATSQVIFRRGARSSLIATLLVAALVAAGYGVRLRHDEHAWVHASVLQHQTLTTISQVVPGLNRNVALLTFDFPAQAAQGVPVFYASQDLQGALQLMTGNPGDLAFPVYEGVQVSCRPRGIAIDGPNEDTGRTSYRDAVFLDVRTRRETPVRSASACRTALRHVAPGPLISGSPGG